MDKELRIGFKEAEKITKKFAKTFYLSSLFLPKAKRNASYAIYAICRLSDESVDSMSSGHAQRLKTLEQTIACAYSNSNTDGPLLAAFSKTVKDYNIPKEYFDELIKGMYMDLEIKNYPDFKSLYIYCYRVAGVVGLIMIRIFGYKNSAAEDYAVKLGIAMQLNNILRDIKEDTSLGRIYLPADEMGRFDVSESQLAKGIINEPFKNLLRFQIDRCRKFYDESLEGIKLIDSRISRLVIFTMKGIYSGILDEIRRNNYDVFTKRAIVSCPRKIMIIFKILLEKKYL